MQEIIVVVFTRKMVLHYKIVDTPGNKQWFTGDHLMIYKIQKEYLAEVEEILNSCFVHYEVYSREYAKNEA